MNQEAMARQSELGKALEEAGLEVLSLEGPGGKLLVVPAMGGRILSAVGAGGEALWWDHRLLGDRKAVDWNVGGQRTWLSPEHSALDLFRKEGNWHCPEGLDPGRWERDFTEEVRGIALANRFPVAVSSGPVTVSLRRRITMLAGKGSLHFEVGQWVAHDGKLPSGFGLGPWAILQVPAPGWVVISVEEGGTCPVRDSFFEAPPTGWIRRGDAYVACWMPGSRIYKIGIPAEGLPGKAWMAYFHRCPGGEWMEARQEWIVQRGSDYADTPDGLAAPWGDAAQVYGHGAEVPLTYVELEAHGPAVHRPGISTGVVVRYAIRWMDEETARERIRKIGAGSLEAELGGPGLLLGENS